MLPASWLVGCLVSHAQRPAPPRPACSGRRVLYDVAKGLCYLHQRRIVHLDLKSGEAGWACCGAGPGAEPAAALGLGLGLQRRWAWGWLRPPSVDIKARSACSCA